MYGHEYTYTESGTTILDCTYYAGALIGDEKQFYENGQLRTCRPYNYGVVADGIVEVYSENGNVLEQEHWENGLCSVFFENGNIKKIFGLKNGVYAGVFKGYFENGQVATQYVDLDGNVSMDEEWNVNGSYMSIEGITSPDGRILGKMAHSERRGESVAINIYGEQDMKIFESGVKYFK